ncbi:BAG family molecular chaperone regulator 1-like [Hydractinia symbiolongicarpus]|uniref:BAG family molecular chaperone regulator 1-like n=1 Tax=Hydractinia symbiolongicarpus TaxID=13093 RepID=UPI00255137C3|nr:BAG family molecular chaperone regulator 1-like [Hydractinia symbiolongicarpus]
MSGVKLREKFAIVHDSKKHEIIIEVPPSHKVTLKDFSDAVARKCGVPQHKQKLICKGKTLTDFSSTLSDLGITSKSKVMVIGKKFDMAEQQNITSIEKIGRQTEELWRLFEEIKQEITGVEQGYLEKEQENESFNKLTKRVKYLGEGLMKNLESLDALNLDSSFLDAREKRKLLITKINGYLSTVDAEEERLKEITSKL